MNFAIWEVNAGGRVELPPPDGLTVPWTHYVSKNCVHFFWHQSHLLCLYKLSYNRFNDHEILVLCQNPTLALICHFSCYHWTYVMTVKTRVFTTAIYKTRGIEIFIAIYFHIMTQYKSIVERTKACRGISIIKKTINLREAACLRYFYATLCRSLENVRVVLKCDS